MKLAGTTRLSFNFPAQRPLAIAYYRNLSRLVAFLPHISLVKAYTPDHFRMLYSANEFGAYDIRVLCDVEISVADNMVRLRPSDARPRIKSRRGLYTTTGKGVYASDSIFHERGDETLIEFALQLKADLPTPTSMRMMPGRMADKLANSIAERRIHEIAAGFIERSIESFPGWLAKHKAGIKA